MAVRAISEMASPPREIGSGERAELEGMLGTDGCSAVTRVRGEIDDARMRSYVRVRAL